VKRSNLVFFNEIATPAWPASAEAPARRTTLWQAGLRAGRRDSCLLDALTEHFGVQARPFWVFAMTGLEGRFFSELEFKSRF
jgi:hypothetical protein